MVSLWIDDKEVLVEEGTTILDAASGVGIYIPTLCYDKRLGAFGGCRVCLVEEKNTGRLLAACSTYAENGAQILTNTEKVKDAIKKQLQLLLINHPLECVVCDKSGECRLQDLVFSYEVFSNPYRREKTSLSIPREKITISYEKLPLIESNRGRCILCGLCTRVCEDIGVYELSFTNRGINTVISTDFDRDLNCLFCGLCIDICPTGALTARVYKHRIRPWELEKIKTVCFHCGMGCRILVETKDNKIYRINSVDGSLLCMKGRFGFEFLEHKERINRPLLKEGNNFKEISYQEAVEIIAKKLIEFAPDIGAIISTSSFTYQELILFEKFFKEILKTENITALPDYVGSIYKIINSQRRIDIETIKNSDLVMLVNYNLLPPIIHVGIYKAVKNNKAELIILNSRPVKYLSNMYGLSPYHKIPSTILLQPKAYHEFINSMINYIIQKNAYSQKITQIKGFHQLIEEVRDYTPKEHIKEITEKLLSSQRPKIITPSTISSMNDYNLMISLHNLSLLIDKPEAFYIIPEELNQLHGMHLTYQNKKSIYNILSEVKLLYIFQEDLFSRFIDHQFIKEKLTKLDFLVVQDLFLTDTAKLANIVIPSLSLFEKSGYVIDTEGKLLKLNKVVNNRHILEDDIIINKLVYQIVGASTLKVEDIFETTYQFLGEELVFEKTKDLTRQNNIPQEHLLDLDIDTTYRHRAKLTDYCPTLLDLERYKEMNF